MLFKLNEKKGEWARAERSPLCQCDEHNLSLIKRANGNLGGKVKPFVEIVQVEVFSRVSRFSIWKGEKKLHGLLKNRTFLIGAVYQTRLERPTIKLIEGQKLTKDIFCNHELKCYPFLYF